jgi:hypothetical protein
VTKQLEAIISRTPSLARPEDRAGVKRVVWESLYAAFVAPQTDPRDRVELIQMIRALKAIDEPDALKSLQVVKRLLRAQPLVPARWFSNRPAPKAPGKDPQAPPVVTPEALDRLEKANALRRRFFSLDRAIEDLRLTERRALASSGRPAMPRPEPQSPKPKPGPTDLTVAPRGELSARNWQLPEAAIETLQPATRTLVTEAGRDLKVDATVDVLKRLEAEQQLAADRLYRTAGSRALVDLDIAVKNDLTLDDIISPTDYQIVGDYDEPFAGSVGSVEPLGIGDLLVVNDKLLRYEFGEAAHIENVMQTESRERVHRQLDRVQTVYATQIESTETSERDLQTTERFELQSEAAKTLESDMSLNTGVNASASYGPMLKVDVSAEFATSSSTSNSQSSSTTYARDVTDRSVSSLTRTIQERTVTTTLTETEETNSHGFDNTLGDGHVVGIYRWVNKRYQAQVLNYGKRVMLEFVVPEPAAFYHQTSLAASATGVPIEEPEPLPEGFSFRDVKPGTYQTWTDLYRVSDVEPPPPFYRTIGRPIEQPETTHGIDFSEDYILTTKTDTLSVPEGYRAIEAWISPHGSAPLDGTHYSWRAAVGRHNFELEQGDLYEPMENEDGEIPVAIKAFNIMAYALTIEVKCEREDSTLEAWQLSTYEAIVTAYNNLKAAYDAQLAAAEVQQGVAITGRNPEANRLIERDELKKGCLVLLTDQHFHDSGSVDTTGTPFGYPEIKVSESMRESSYIQFMEQCFEWNQMTYTFYPYFWGNKKDWASRSMVEDVDPAFADFLKAGAARVLVPVQRTYEKALMYFLETAQIWNGGEAPTINNEHYVSIVEEMEESQDVAFDKGEPYGDPWEYTLPTTLVMLQEDAALPEFVESPA